jgi:hypothetical protein
MSLQVQLQNLATRMATECKSLRTLLNNNAGNLNALTTAAKGNLVAAVNELQAEIEALTAASGAQINDASNASLTQTYSVTKILQVVQQAKDDLTNGAASALDTLGELAAALQNDPNVVANLVTAVGNRVRYDAAQALTTPQQLQACQNIGVGDPETNFVTGFEAGLV